jgi:mRNA interferase RelE/StbE
MPWYTIAYRPEVVSDLAQIDTAMAQRLLDKTKWLASNVGNLRHDPLDAELPGLSHYAVGDWRIFYSIDQSSRIVDVHLIAHCTRLHQPRPQGSRS